MMVQAKQSRKSLTLLEVVPFTQLQVHGVLHTVPQILTIQLLLQAVAQERGLQKYAVLIQIRYTLET